MKLAFLIFLSVGIFSFQVRGQEVSVEDIVLNRERDKLSYILGIDEIECTFRTSKPYSDFEVLVDFYTNGRLVETKQIEGSLPNMTDGTINLQLLDLEETSFRYVDNDSVRLAIMFKDKTSSTWYGRSHVPKSTYSKRGFLGSGVFRSKTGPENSIPVFWIVSQNTTNKFVAGDWSPEELVARNSASEILIVSVKLK